MNIFPSPQSCREIFWKNPDATKARLARPLVENCSQKKKKRLCLLRLTVEICQYSILWNLQKLHWRIIIVDSIEDTECQGIQLKHSGNYHLLSLYWMQFASKWMHTWAWQISFTETSTGEDAQMIKAASHRIIVNSALLHKCCDLGHNGAKVAFVVLIKASDHALTFFLSPKSQPIPCL